MSLRERSSGVERTVTFDNSVLVTATVKSERRNSVAKRVLTKVAWAGFHSQADLDAWRAAGFTLEPLLLAGATRGAAASIRHTSLRAERAMTPKDSGCRWH
jgi:hypothetical protein